FAEEVGRRHTCVVEDELARRRAFDPHLRLDAGDLESRRVRLDHERGDPCVPLIRIRLGEHRVQLRDTRVRDEPLRSIQDVLVTFAPGRRPHGRRVGARAGLGERIGAEPFTRRQAREVALLLRLVPGELQTERAELLDGENQTARRADLRDLFDRHQGQESPGPETAVLLAEEEPEEVVLTEELDDVRGKLMALVDLRRSRRDPLARELTNEIADLALLLAQLLVRHAGSLVSGDVYSPSSDPRERGRADDGADASRR